MSDRRETIRCVESGEPFGLPAVWEGMRAAPLFSGGVILVGFATILPGAGLTLAALVSGAVMFLLVGRLVILSWRNPIYRNLRWMGLLTLSSVAGSAICAVTVSPALGKSMLCAGAVLLAVQVPMYPFLRPVKKGKDTASDRP